MTIRALLVYVLLPLAALPASAGEINFVYPAEGAQLPSVAKTFVFGNIVPATAPFTINGEKISVYSNGGFIAYLPVSEGDFAFKGQLADGTTAQRALKIKVSADARPSTGTVWLELQGYAADSELFPGDNVRLAAVGTPGKEAAFSLGGAAEGAMTESPAGSGRYYASYLLKPSDAGAEFYPAVRFKAGLFGRGASARAKGRVRVLRALSVVETSTEAVVLRNATDGGYIMFLPKGVKLAVNGRANGMRRVRLSPYEDAWVDDSKVQPSQGAPYLPASETGSIKLKRTEFGSSAQIALYDKVPFYAEETENGLRLKLYYTNLHTNWVVYDSSDTLVRNVAFRQDASETAEIDFETGPGALWGYNISYSTAARALQVDLRARPKMPFDWPRPLSGLTVVLDPGHSPKFTVPYDGAIGPKGTFEFQVNLAIAKKLSEKLSALGAAVKMTRNGDETVALADRPKLARDLGGDLYISVHNNAIGDGEDPFSQPRGFSVYHYQRHSRDLAAAIHRAYVRDIPLPDEGLRYGDYLVARMTWMPAVLIENAYMILPRQEELLNAPAFQEQLAGAVTEGVLSFFKVQPQPRKVKK